MAKLLICLCLGVASATCAAIQGGVILKNGDRHLLCEVNLTSGGLERAHFMALRQLLNRPFAYMTLDGRTKPEVFQHLGMYPITLKDADDLVLYAVATDAGISAHLGHVGLGIWQPVTRVKLEGPPPSVWMAAADSRKVKKKDLRELQRVTIGYTSDLEKDDTRTFLTITREDDLQVEAVLGVDVPCYAVDKYTENDERFLSRLKVNGRELCRIKAFYFRRYERLTW